MLVERECQALGGPRDGEWVVLRLPETQNYVEFEMVELGSLKRAMRALEGEVVAQQVPTVKVRYRLEPVTRNDKDYFLLVYEGNKAHAGE